MPNFESGTNEEIAAKPRLIEELCCRYLHRQKTALDLENYLKPASGRAFAKKRFGTIPGIASCAFPPFLTLKVVNITVFCESW